MTDQEDLQQQIDKLEDRWFALVGLVNSLIASLRDAGIPLNPTLERHLCSAANDLDEYQLEEAAIELDELRDVVDVILRPEDSEKENIKT